MLVVPCFSQYHDTHLSLSLSLSLAVDDTPERTARYITRSRKRGSSGIVAQITQNFAARMELRSPRLREADTSLGGPAGALTEGEGEGEGEGVVVDGDSSTIIESAGGKAECSKRAMEDAGEKTKDTEGEEKRVCERKKSRSGRRKEELRMQNRSTRSSSRLTRENGDVYRSSGGSGGPGAVLQEPETGQAIVEAAVPPTEEMNESQARDGEPHTAVAETVDGEDMDTSHAVVGEANVHVVAVGDLDVGVDPAAEEYGISDRRVATNTSINTSCGKEGPACTDYGDVTTCPLTCLDSATPGPALTSGQADHTAEQAGPTSNQASITAEQAGPTSNQASISIEQAGPTSNQASISIEQAGPTSNQASVTAEQASSTSDKPSLTTGQDGNVGAVSAASEEVGVNVESAKEKAKGPHGAGTEGETEDASCSGYGGSGV